MTAPVDARVEAVRLRSQEGLGCKRIARLLGVSPSTVRRWTNPDYAERQLRLSREAKQRRTGVCEICGGVTRYAGARNADQTPVSLRCDRCGRERSRERMRAKRGSGPMQERILAFLSDGPRRFTEIRMVLDIADRSRLAPHLHRLVAYGLIERVERGLYRRVEERSDG